jgi:hypothetical protein
MRPHVRGRGAKEAALGRARLLLKSELGWMRGYPLREDGALFWLSPAEVGSARPEVRTRLAAAELHRASLAARRLHREHASALDRVFGDRSRWLEHTLAVIDALKPAVHQDAPLADVRLLVSMVQGPRAARRLAALLAKRAIAPAATALAWLYLRDERLPAVLTWLEEEAGSIEGIEVPVIVRLCELGLTDGADRVRSLLLTLALDGADVVPLEADKKSSGELRSGLGGKTPSWPEAPKPWLRPRFAELSAALVPLARGPRRRLYGVIAALAPEIAALLGLWRRWWSLHDPLVAEARERLPRIGFAPNEKAQLFVVAERLKRLEEQTPVELDVTAIVERLRGLADAPEGVLRALATALEAIPQRSRDGRPRRLAFFCQWLAFGHASFLERWLRSFGRWLRRAPDVDVALAHWQTFWSTPRLPRTIEYACAERYLLYERSAGGVDAFFQALAQSAPGASAPLCARLVALGCDGAEAAQLEAAIRRVCPPHEGWTSDGVIQTARALAAGDVDRFAAVLGLLAKPDLSEHVERQAPAALVALCRDPEAARVLCDSVLAGHGRRVLAVAGRLQVLDALGARPPRWHEARAAAGRSAWIRRYPTSLQALLARLAVVDPDARATADRLLGHAFADPAAVRREIAALEAQIAAGGRVERMRARVANLRRRLESPRPPTPAQLEGLRKKLAERVDQRLLDGYDERLAAVLATAMAPVIGTGELPAWLLESPCIDLLPHLAALDARTRRLAFRVLRARARPYPWDLRDEGANAAFLEALRARGVDPLPWLDGIGIVVHEAPKGRLYLQLERDPLEVLRMGAYFETCLSPGGVNFFSTVSNAADVNKRVLYGRDERGAVMARVLLCLTREGNVIAFHPYCHDPEGWGFAEAAAAFVAQLCERMGTQPVLAAPVPLLLARDWYDDGPVDLTTRFAPLQHGSAFLERLDAIAPEAVVAALEEALGRLDAVTLPLVLALPVVRRRGELVVALFEPLAMAASDLPLELRADAALRAWNAGHRDAARRFFYQHVLRDLERAVRRGRLSLQPWPLVPLVELGDPSLALRAARVAVKGTAQPNAGWLYLMARAHEALRRPQRAAALYRDAMKIGWEGLVKDCEARLAALGA